MPTSRAIAKSLAQFTAARPKSAVEFFSKVSMCGATPIRAVLTKVVK